MWIESKKFDLTWIIGPAYFSFFFVIILQGLNIAPKEISPIYWLIFVVFIDVAHVWSSLFRTYLNKDGRIKYAKSLWLAPISCYALGVILHAQSSLLFWRVLAYFAVFHFVRQQYGIFQIYRSQEQYEFRRTFLFDKIVIYSSTIFPLLIWHLHRSEKIFWFMQGDFYHLNFPELIPWVASLAWGIYAFYFFYEVIFLKNPIGSPSKLFLLGTILVWWGGIVWLKTDWSFTITNVVAHGIPYFALIYLKDLRQRERLIWPSFLPMASIFVFLFILAFFEEGLWDAFIWKDHDSLFSFLGFLPSIENINLLALLVPLLTLPQATHYFLDGFIWKKDSDQPSQ